MCILESFYAHLNQRFQRPLFDSFTCCCSVISHCSKAFPSVTSAVMTALFQGLVPMPWSECILGHSNISPLAHISVQSLKSCPTLCDPMHCSTPGLPVHHQLPEFTQTHIHQVGDAIQPSHPLSSPSPPAPNPSQHQSLFQ